MKLETLERTLGLSSLEARVYLAALTLGQASIQQIARKSGVPRTSIYNFLQRLLDRKLLVETIKGKRSVYSAGHPRRIRDAAAGELKALDDSLPSLVRLYDGARRRPHVTFYDGIEGIKELYEDTLRDNLPIIAWTDYEHMFNVMNRYLSRYPKERTKRGIFFRSIARDSRKTQEMVKRNASEMREIKRIQAEDLRTEINVYGNKVAIMSFRKQFPLAVLIEDEDIARTLRIVWEKMWAKL